jgi:hypothetical protein
MKEFAAAYLRSILQICGYESYVTKTFDAYVVKATEEHVKEIKKLPWVKDVVVYEPVMIQTVRNVFVDPETHEEFEKRRK